MVAVSLLVADSIENGISTVDVYIAAVFFSPQKHAAARIQTSVHIESPFFHLRSLRRLCL